MYTNIKGYKYNRLKKRNAVTVVGETFVDINGEYYIFVKHRGVIYRVKQNLTK